MNDELDKLLFDHKNTFHLYHIGRGDGEAHDKACQALLDYINQLNAQKLESSKSEDAPPPKSLVDAIEEQIRRLFDRIGSKDDQLQRLQAKVENMYWRLDLNVAARKRIDALEQRVAQLERTTRGETRYDGVKMPILSSAEYRPCDDSGKMETQANRD